MINLKTGAWTGIAYVLHLHYMTLYLELFEL